VSLFRAIDWDDLERSQSNEPFVPFRRQRAPGHLANGSMRCLHCDVPIVLRAPLPLSGRMRCPFCRSIDDVRSFVDIDVPDTALNAVELRARLPV
jgi:hypothetical protein